MTYPSLSPGDDPGPIFSASRHNAINELLAKSGIASTATAKTPGSKRQNTIALVKNTTDADVPRGGVRGLSGLIFNADDNENAFAGNDIQFAGEKPTSESHADRIGIAIDLCPQSKIRSFVVEGWVQARVDIKNTSHTRAIIVDDDVEKLETSETGYIPLVAAQSGTGIKWAAIRLGVNSTRPAVIGLGDANEAVATTDSTFDMDGLVLLNGSWSDTTETGTPTSLTIQNTFSWAIDDNGKVLAQWNYEDEQWEAIQAECQS